MNSYINILLFFTILGILLYAMNTLTKQEPYSEISELPEKKYPPPKSRIAIAVQMRKPIDLPLWLKHHREIGIVKFYIRIEDSPGWEDYLQVQPDVEYELGHSDSKGNNYETVVDRQVDWVNRCMKKAREENIDWIFNIDADELLHGDLSSIDNIKSTFKCIRLENAEAIYTESNDTCFASRKFIRCKNSHDCKAYVNGKGGGRIEDGVKQAGAHHFEYKGEIEGKHVYEMPFTTMRVLHFDSCSLGSWMEKFHHLAKNKKDNIPFPYYYESMDVIENAYEVYKKHKIRDPSTIKKDELFERFSNPSNIPIPENQDDSIEYTNYAPAN